MLGPAHDIPTSTPLIAVDIIAAGQTAAEDALDFAARALRQVSIDSQDWTRLLSENKAFAMGKHGKPLYMPKK